MIERTITFDELFEQAEKHGHAVTAYIRGHEVYWNNANSEWCYSDNNEPYTEDRPCVRCGKKPTSEGYDACLGHIPGVKQACCGHGVEEPYTVEDE